MADDFTTILREARKAGAEISTRTSGHLRITAPDGRSITAARSPSDHRAVHRLRQDLRRLGLLPPAKFTLTDEERAFLDDCLAHGAGLRVTELPPKRLLDKELVRISKRSKGWMVWITDKGRAL
jgi:hypothetical protein